MAEVVVWNQVMNSLQVLCIMGIAFALGKDASRAMVWEV